MYLRLQKPITPAELSVGNSSEDLVGNDLSDNDGEVVENEDADVD